MGRRRIRGLPPVVGRGAKILVLGSMPGALSLEKKQYYAHPRNAFWRMVGVDPDLSYTAKCRELERRDIALWDVVERCERTGSSLDSKIRGETPNDLTAFCSRHPGIRRILFNGKKARQVFDRCIGEDKLPECVRLKTLPSTSPANTSRGKRVAWRRALGGFRKKA